MYRLLIVLLLTGCSSQIIQPEPFDNTSDLKKLESASLPPIELPEKPIANIQKVDGIKYGSFNEQQMESLNKIWAGAKANEKTIGILNKANREAVDSHNNLLNLTRLYERQIYVVEKELQRSEQQREKEEKINTIRSIIDKTIMVVLGIALVL